VKVTQLGGPSVCLSSSPARDGAAETTEYVAIHVPIKIEDRVTEDLAPLARLRLLGGSLFMGNVIDKRPSGGWLLFKVPQELCPDGGVLTLYASLDGVVLWEKAYRVVWRERFPGLEQVP
jgi:hypothetical protein